MERTANTQWILLIKNVLVIFAIAFVPAVVELIFEGGDPPSNIPFHVTAEDLEQRTGAIVWIDARPEVLFKDEHIPGALNLNKDNWDQALAQLFEVYQPGKTIVVYCSSGCFASEEIASKIRNLGLSPVLVLEGGLDTWQKLHHRS